MSRRLVLTTGAGAFGIAVLGACSSSSSGDGPGGGTAGAGTSSAGGPASEASGSGDLTWKRVEISFVSAYLLIRGQEVTVVDTGTADSAGEIDAGLKAAGRSWGDVKHVILTHNHPDHAGGWPSVEQHVPGAILHVGEEDIASVTSTVAPSAVKDGDEVFGLRIVGSPGHTPGHICVYDPATGVLVAGDALTNEGELQGSNPQYTVDGDAAAASVKKLAALSPEVVLFGHGAPLEQDAAAALTKLAATL